MRPIKFRAWGKGWRDTMPQMYNENNVAVIGDTVLLYGGHNIKTLVYTFEEFPLEVMQFIGLKDANGRDIYEGDVVTDVHDNAGTVKWNLDRWSLYDGDKYWSPTHHGMCEVIGNIYQNPELLKV